MDIKQPTFSLTLFNQAGGIAFQVNNVTVVSVGQSGIVCRASSGGQLIQAGGGPFVLVEEISAQTDSPPTS